MTTNLPQKFAPLSTEGISELQWVDSQAKNEAALVKNPFTGKYNYHRWTGGEDVVLKPEFGAESARLSPDGAEVLFFSASQISIISLKGGNTRASTVVEAYFTQGGRLTLDAQRRLRFSQNLEMGGYIVNTLTGETREEPASESTAPVSVDPDNELAGIGRKALDDQFGYIWHYQLSRDGNKLLLSVSQPSGTQSSLIEYEIKTQRVVRRREFEGLDAIFYTGIDAAFKRVAFWDGKGDLRLLNWETGEVLLKQPLPKLDDKQNRISCRSIAIANDLQQVYLFFGNQLAVVTIDPNPDNAPMVLYHDYREDLHAETVSSDDKLLAFAIGDEIMVYEPEHDRHLYRFNPREGRISSLAFVNDTLGEGLVASLDNGTLVRYRIDRVSVEMPAASAH